MSLYTDLVDAGLNVATVNGWANRGGIWAVRQPVGIMHHHTAPPVPFPVNRLDGSTDGRLKCNINTKPDGTVWLIAEGACNYSSGPGSRVVLDQVLAGEAPTANARDRDLVDNVNGNPWFFNFENDHPGNGSRIPEVQLDAIVTATRVVCDRYGLEVGSVISHAEWTRRKIDPYWNNDRRAIETIREETAAMASPFKDVPTDHPHYNAIDWLADEGITKGCNPPANDRFCPDDYVTRAQMATFLKRAHDVTIREVRELLK